MEDGNVVNANDDKITLGSLKSLYGDRSVRFTANGHEPTGDPSSLLDKSYGSCHSNIASTQEENYRKRINPLRIHLGKRPFVDNSHHHLNTAKKRKTFVIKNSDSAIHSNVPRMPKLIPKCADLNQFHNVTPQSENNVDNEQNKPVPRLVPKSQLLHYKKGKIEKGSQLKEYAQSLGLQPMVKFKCRKCCSMSFKTLAMLKDHQLVCRAQAKEPTLSPEGASCPDMNSSGPPRVTRKVYLCSACGTYYENWNLFLHMREVHNRHICLFCLGMFSKAEKLSSHLCNKHNVKELNFNSKEDFFNVFNGTLYLMCCVCEEICSEQDDFFNHDCNNVKPKPVPVLISKNSVKPNNIKSIKNSNEYPVNGPTTIIKELPNHYSDKREANGIRFDISSHLNKDSTDTVENGLGTSFLGTSKTSTSSDISAETSKDTSNPIDSGMELEHLDKKTVSSPIRNDVVPDRTIHLPNGDDYINNSEESTSSSDHPEHQDEESITKCEESICPPVVKEKECGIKLTLSLNSANSPVIINSTVDPSVGHQSFSKPPSRLRRPPKRYEKESSADLMSLMPEPKTPSIIMTICDRADSPFVKTTIYENNKETTLKTVNNNLDYVSTSSEVKHENLIKTTIYDNKLEDLNTLNRVPKLTVRVPKELLDKDSSSDYSSDSDISEKLTVDENKAVTNEQENLKEDIAVKTETTESNLTSEEIKEEANVPTQVAEENCVDLDPKIEPKIEPPEEEETLIEPVIEEPSIPVTELSLDRPLDKYPLKDLLKVFLASTVHSCIYCNHVRKIAVNCEQLSLHMVSQHRFAATVDSITAEELLPETITAKLKSRAQELSSVYINLDSYDSVEKCETVKFDHLFECFQCYFQTAIHKDLYLHNRKMHQKTILLCVMCKCNFYSYSELLCHLCPGTYNSDVEIKFRCCLCNVDSIPSQFRLMVHLRKIHHTCDVCLEFCQNQARLSNHVWKHKLHHLCYRCGIAYRNKPDITNHLFWKHGTESVLCKRCLQKKWSHVYHFCIPPAVFACEECNLQFTKSVCLKVHKRFHSSEFPHVCTEEECTQKFVSKKLLNKHLLDHRKTQLITDLRGELTSPSKDNDAQESKETIPVIDLVADKPLEEAGSSEVKTEREIETSTKKQKKKKLRDALLLDVNLPALNLSESDSSDESDSGVPSIINNTDVKQGNEEIGTDKTEPSDLKILLGKEPGIKTALKIEPIDEIKPSEQQVLDIWDNFKKYQATVEKQKEKTPPLVTIRRHVCESDHDYCLIPTDVNGDDNVLHTDKKAKSKKSKKQRSGFFSSSSSSSDTGSTCTCKTNCSCSSSTGSSSSSSSDSDSSDESGPEKKKTKKLKKILPNRRISTGSNVDVMGNAETPILIPEKVEPPIAETDLETEESDTDEDFYDEHPQRTVDKLYEEKRNQLLMLPSVAPSDGGSISGEASRPCTPVPEENPLENKIVDENIQEIKNQQEVSRESIIKEDIDTKTKPMSSKKKNKKKKKSKSSRKRGPIKINIPKEIIPNPEVETSLQLPPNKITISLQSNTVQLPEAPNLTLVNSNNVNPATSAENKRASKRRRVPNKFYGYSSDEEQPQSTLNALKPQQPPKLEWRKEDLPSPVTNKIKKEVPSTVISNRLYNYTDTIRLTTPIPDPEPPRILMNTESMESSDSDSSENGNLEIYQPTSEASVPIPPPTYLNSGTSSLPYAFQRPAVREAREGESVYCYCRCPYDEVSEMIACDAEGCPIEWFHFECVGIMVPPKGKWYCPECRKNQNYPGYR